MSFSFINVDTIASLKHIFLKYFWVNNVSYVNCFNSTFTLFLKKQGGVEEKVSGGCVIHATVIEWV